MPWSDVVAASFCPMYFHLSRSISGPFHTATMNFPSLRVTTFFAVMVGALPRLQAIDFQKDIAPILKKNCYECHSEEKKKEKSGEVFDNLKRFAHDIGVNLLIEPGSPSSSHF